ncbi:P-loop containing nucleoside triphosphate hydrolase protein [Epithele typhae]|uniref:P-loop containing nucleoside triphosphate hydrolase protein n=1 Tax=Epithele typhae TaxID=378194 RepID=UPI002007D280|nr:P-loop containing nucleoside triphosphate hydrolase protein [Epithele typhae]KAH9940489.1 P-loop containing nucleoside triphosphate hydrolase protein [Epithele typhae]
MARRSRPSKLQNYALLKSGIPRPRLTEDDITELKAHMRESFKWDSDPRDFQLKAVVAQIEGVDMIVQAPTGAGKTALAAGPHVWPAFANKVTLMVSPLMALEEEMVDTFRDDFGLKAVTLHSKNGGCSMEEIEKILNLEYQVVIVSPEMLQSRRFTDLVLRNSKFTQNIVSMFIDEAHCVVHWGADFRKSYGTLGKIRAFLPPCTPVIAVTATLTRRVRRALYGSLLFSQSEARSRFVNKGNDRPNISLVIRGCEHPLNTFADLDFVISENIQSVHDIPKTYLYVQKIAIGNDIIAHLYRRLWEILPELRPGPNQPKEAGCIRLFNATMSARYRKCAMAAFREGQIRIMVCTDAAGMGCNILDVERVIIWKMPETFSHFVQRAGRAARGRGTRGVAILLVERSAYNTNIVDNMPASLDEKPVGKIQGTKEKAPRADSKEVKEYARAHGVNRGGSKQLDDIPNGKQPQLNPASADEGLLSFVQSTSCRREVWAQVFEIPDSERHPLAEGCPCCDLCHPKLFDLARPAPCPREKTNRLPTKGLPDPTARAALAQWRKMVHARDHPLAWFNAKAILPDVLLDSLVSYGSVTPIQIRAIMKEPSAVWTDRLTAELCESMAHLQIRFVPNPKKISVKAILEHPLPSSLPVPPTNSAGSSSCKPVQAVPTQTEAARAPSPDTMREPPPKRTRTKTKPTMPPETAYYPTSVSANAEASKRPRGASASSMAPPPQRKRLRATEASIYACDTPGFPYNAAGSTHDVSP